LDWTAGIKPAFLLQLDQTSANPSPALNFVLNIPRITAARAIACASSMNRDNISSSASGC
jgi:hypothetical protein